MKQPIRLLFAACLAAAAAPAPAQYPAKPVRVVVSTVPGPLDTFARMVLDKMSASLKQPFVVENKPGAGGNIAADMVAKTNPDGYTLGLVLNSVLTVNPSVY